MIEKYGLDQFKYFLLREVTLGQDGDFSEYSFKARINSELSNNLGNLIQRTLKNLQVKILKIKCLLKLMI